MLDHGIRLVENKERERQGDGNNKSMSFSFDPGNRQKYSKGCTLAKFAFELYFASHQVNQLFDNG